MAQPAVAELFTKLHDHIARITGKPPDPVVLRLSDQIELLSASGPTLENLREEYRLSPKERRLFNQLAGKPGAVFTRQSLWNGLYFDYVGEDEPDVNIIDVWITKIRAKLVKHDAPVWIETIWAEGYRFVNKRAREECSKPGLNGQPRPLRRRY